MTLKNKSFILTLLLIVLGLAVPVLAQEPAATSSPDTSMAPPIADLGNSSFVPGEILVKFKPGLKSQGANNGLARVGGRAVEKVPAIDVTRVEVPQGRELAAAAALQTSGDVAFAEPNYIAYALDTPSDPYFSSQWAYDVAEFSSAWDITKGNSDVVVAVIDTGRMEVEKYLLVGQRVWNLAFSPDRKRLFTTNGVSNDMSMTDLDKLRVRKSIAVGRLPWGVVVAP